jgi:serine/threonine protein kinase
MAEFPTIPGYRAEKELGQGGMATVYLAYQEKLDRYVALKVLKPHLAGTVEATERFLKEARTAAKLIHPNIITVFDSDHYGDWYYLTMENLEGGNLLDRLPRGGDRGMEPRAALLIARKVTQALEHAHSRGFIHRDIKPENVMFRTDGTPVLVDFGIARATDSGTQFTQMGMSIGTPWYMSPEQVSGERLDGRSDLYSLGVLLYELLTGKVPYDAPEPIAVAVKHLHEPVPRLPDPLLRFQPLIDALMAKDRRQRVQSSTLLLTMLDAWLDDTPKANAAGKAPNPQAVPHPGPLPAPQNSTVRAILQPKPVPQLDPERFPESPPPPPEKIPAPPRAPQKWRAAPPLTLHGWCLLFSAWALLFLAAAQVTAGVIEYLKFHNIPASPFPMAIALRAALNLLLAYVALIFRRIHSRRIVFLALFLSLLDLISPLVTGDFSLPASLRALLVNLVWLLPLAFGWKKLEK